MLTYHIVLPLLEILSALRMKRNQKKDKRSSKQNRKGGLMARLKRKLSQTKTKPSASGSDSQPTKGIDLATWLRSSQNNISAPPLSVIDTTERRDHNNAADTRSLCPSIDNVSVVTFSDYTYTFSSDEESLSDTFTVSSIDSLWDTFTLSSLSSDSISNLSMDTISLSSMSSDGSDQVSNQNVDIDHDLCEQIKAQIDLTRYNFSINPTSVNVLAVTKSANTCKA